MRKRPVFVNLAPARLEGEGTSTFVPGVFASVVNGNCGLVSNKSKCQLKLMSLAWNGKQFVANDLPLLGMHAGLK